MRKNLVVPLDGSDLSELALPVGTSAAARLGGALTLLTTGWGSTTEDLKEYLDGRASGVGEVGDVEVTTAVVPDRFPAAAIVEQARETDAVVCMATHGRSGIGKALLGSVAEDVLRETDRPVLLLGPRAQAGPLGDGPMVLCVDGSPTAESVIDVAIETATALGLPVTVVTVARPDGVVLGSDGSRQADEIVGGVVARLGAAGLTVGREQREGSDAAPAILDVVSSAGASLIALATHARTGFARTTLGSVAMKVVHDSACPVLVVRPAGT